MSKTQRLFPTRAEFAAWLKENPGRGDQHGNPGPCPIAACLLDRGATHLSVGVVHWYADKAPRGDCRMPGWARDFIRHFDATGERRIP